MSPAPLASQLDAAILPLSELYLDPNNPRFTGPDWIYVSDAEAHLAHHQEKALSRLIKEFGADKLRMNMEVNGYLPIDRIIVKKLSESIYIVLEGNRRVAAAKTISKYTADGSEINTGVMESLQKIPCLIYNGDDADAAWVFQGLRHITGINDWSSYNKAKLLVEQMERENITLTETGRRFGLSAYGAGQWVRGYKAFKQAREETDYVSEIDERIYPYFQELFGRSSAAMKEWLGWDEQSKRFSQIANLNEFVGWFYPRPDLAAEGLPDEQPSSGDWYKRVIGKQDDIRQLSYLASKAPKYFDQFRSEKDLEKAYSRARFDEIERSQEVDSASHEHIFDKLAASVKALHDIPISIVKNVESRKRLDNIFIQLEDAIKFIRE